MRKVGVLGTVASLIAAGLSIAVAAPASANGCSNTLFGGDNPDGSAGDPFLISTDTHLQNLKENESCWASQYNFRQTTDIDMSDTWEDHSIGYASGSTFFEGTYDGDGNEITGLTIDFRGDESSGFDSGGFAGLFGFLTGTVTNLGFTGSVFGAAIPARYVGGLVGYSNGGTVDNSYATGAVEGYGYVGGLVGRNDGGSVADSHATGSVTASGDYVGGLIGDSTTSGSVTGSYATGAVSGDEYTGGLIGYASTNDVVDSYASGAVSSTGDQVGGLIGYSSGSSVDGSYATGSVEATTGQDVGGLIGYSSSTAVVDTYATGSVSANQYVGGLLGTMLSGSITDSYATGSVTGITSPGGLVGNDVPLPGDITSAFWDTLTSGQDTSQGGEGKTTAEMTALATFEDAGWDIADSWASSNTWGICEGSGYPYLTWQYTSNTEACGGGSTPAASSGTATYTFTFLTSGGGVCFVDDNVAAGAYALPTSQVACTPEGTELVGWSVRGQVGAFSDGGVVTASGDQTFTAVAKDPTIEVTFDPNVGSGAPCLLEGSDVEPDQRAIEMTLPRGGEIGDVNICAPDGHTLAGWTDRPTTDGPYAPVEGAVLLTTGMEMPVTWHHDPNPVNSIRLYAVWSPVS